MNYYEDLLKKIEDLIQNKKEDEARKLILEELNAPYVPRDILNKLESFLDEIGYDKEKNYELSDEDLNKYLNGTLEQQLIAVSVLDKKNLRQYINECEHFLCSDGFINAKVLLVDSLIKQEIDEEIKMIDETAEYSFIPKYIIPVEESYAFLSGKKVLEDIFLKDPSKFKIAKDLLYKELMMKLPLNLESDEGIIIALDIIKYVYKAFGEEEAIEEIEKLDIIDNEKYYLN